jgi:rare lipoprotein A
VPTSAIFVRYVCHETACDSSAARTGLRSGAWAAAALAFVVAASTGCAASPPCRCTCEACYVDGAQPSVPQQAAASTDAGRPAYSDSGAEAGKPSRARAASRAGETLSEAQLLERYEGKRAVQVLNGKATYYANSLAGRKTASGEPYEPSVFSAAHRTLPFGTVVRVVRTDTNKYVYVRITDRGPFAGGGRIIDLSYVAAERLGMIRAGVVPVRIEVLR